MDGPLSTQAIVRVWLQSWLCSHALQMFLYGLCQASLRPMITKLLGWGPSRGMLEVKPFVPRPLKEMDLFKQQ